jgi:hypothetical protein
MLGLGGIMGMSGPMGLEDCDGWGKWEATPTVVLNADADYGRDGSVSLLGTSDALAPSDYYLI